MFGHRYVRVSARAPARISCTPAQQCLRSRWVYRQPGGAMPSADEIRDAQRATWAGLSSGWGKWDSVIMDQLAPVSAAIIERLDIAEDLHNPDKTDGTGGP